MKNYAGNPGRSSHAMSVMASEKIYECRERIARLFHSRHPENVVFTYNATYALNMALQSLLPRNPGHIIISDTEHNSVIRPVNALTAKGWRYSVISSYGTDEQILDSIRKSIRRDTVMAVLSHRSNVCGITLPIEKIGALLAQKDITYIVDASQSAGSVDIDIEKAGIDALCAPGHKGLYGAQGCGFILFSEKYESTDRSLFPRPFIYGGNGINSLDRSMPPFLPERLEGGTLSTPAIAGLCEGIKFVTGLGVENIGLHEKKLKRHLTEALSAMRKVTLYATDKSDGGTVLFNVDGVSSQTVASELDSLGICVRSGFHCSPLAHKMLKTGEDGAVRVSFGIFNTESEADVLARAVKRISGR